MTSLLDLNHAPRLASLQRQKLEASLDESEMQRFAIDAAGIGTWCWQIDTDEVVWSHRCCELFGVGDAPGDYATFLSFIHIDDRERCDDVLRRCLGGEAPYEIEFRVGSAQAAQVRWVASNGVVQQDESGRPMRMLGAVQDITARRQAMRERDELRLQILKVQEQERHRLARDLHDQAGQELARVLLDIDALARVVNDRQGNLFARLRRQVERVGGSLHRIAMELRPSALDELGLCEAIQEHLADWRDRLGIAIELDCDGQLDDLPDEVKIALFRITQEAMTNVSKHAAGVSTVKVALVRTEAAASLTVEDDGRGFDPAALRAGGMALGIAGMRERLDLLGGELTLQAPPKGGTRLSAQIPLGGFGITDHERRN